MTKAAKIADVLRDHPEWTDRAIARAVGCSPTSVGKVRAKPASADNQQAPGLASGVQSESGQAEVDILPETEPTSEGEFCHQYAPARETAGHAVHPQSGHPATEFRDQYAQARACEAALVDRGVRHATCARILASTSGALLPLLVDHLAQALRVEAWRDRRMVDGSIVGHPSPRAWIEAPRPNGLGEPVSVLLGWIERYSPDQLATISAALAGSADATGAEAAPVQPRTEN